MEMVEHLGREVIILSNQVKHYLHQAAESEGISGAQSRILHFIYLKGNERDIFQKDIEESFYLGRSTVTQTLQSMEKSGLIMRCSVEHDARLKKLVLTEKGRALNERIDKKINYMEEQLKSNLCKEEIQQFYSLMGKMSENLMKLNSDRIYGMKEKVFEQEVKEC